MCLSQTTFRMMIFQSFVSSVFVNTFQAFCLEITERILAACANLLTEAGGRNDLERGK